MQTAHTQKKKLELILVSFCFVFLVISISTQQQQKIDLFMRSSIHWKYLIGSLQWKNCATHFSFSLVINSQIHQVHKIHSVDGRNMNL